MAQIGHLPGLSILIWGCIEHVQMVAAGSSAGDTIVSVFTFDGWKTSHPIKIPANNMMAKLKYLLEKIPVSLFFFII